jgi:hypothetical protein
MRPRIRKLIQGVHMGLGHDGLKVFLQEHADIDISAMHGNDLVMCLNGKGDKLKVIGCKGMVFGYLKMPRGQKIMGEALRYIPETFGHSGFDYDAACMRALTSRMGATAIRRGPLNTARAAREAGL